MSLTSYRAAPPRDQELIVWPTPSSGARNFGSYPKRAQNGFFAERIRLHSVEVVLISMSRLKIKRLASIVSAVLAGFIIIAGCATPKTVAPSPPTATQPNVPILAPGPNDARIAYVTARLLEEFHYSQQLLDTDISQKFFDGYLETLDPRHENFLQSDIDEFALYRTNLDSLTIGTNGTANLTPAYAIYQRYLERLQQHADYVNELLKEDKFKFNTDEHILLDRRHAPYPKDLDEAEQLWAQRLRYEYLQEKLSREISPTNGNVILPLTKSADGGNRRHARAALPLESAHGDELGQHRCAAGLSQRAGARLRSAFGLFQHRARAGFFHQHEPVAVRHRRATVARTTVIAPSVSSSTAARRTKANNSRKKTASSPSRKATNRPWMSWTWNWARSSSSFAARKEPQVRLTISPADDRAARRVVTLIRDEIKLEDQEAKAQAH